MSAGTTSCSFRLDFSDFGERGGESAAISGGGVALEGLRTSDIVVEDDGDGDNNDDDNDEEGGRLRGRKEGKEWASNLCIYLCHPPGSGIPNFLGRSRMHSDVPSRNFPLQYSVFFHP